MVKLYEWSHTAGDWMYHASFESAVAADNYIRSHGYDPRLFKRAE